MGNKQLMSILRGGMQKMANIFRKVTDSMKENMTNDCLRKLQRMKRGRPTVVREKYILNYIFMSSKYFLCLLFTKLSAVLLLSNETIQLYQCAVDSMWTNLHHTRLFLMNLSQALI